MTLLTNELYSSNTRGPLPRIQPAEGPGSVVARVFKAGTAETLEVGTPLYVDANGEMVKLVPGATAHATAPVTETPVAFIWPTAVTTHGTLTVHGTVMLKGQIHVDDVATAMGGSSANLLHNLRNPKVRYAGLHIDGLTIAQ
jgi:hypothetical protein